MKRLATRSAKVMEATLKALAHEAYWDLVSGGEAADLGVEFMFLRGDWAEAVIVDFSHIDEDTTFTAYEIDYAKLEAGEDFIVGGERFSSNSFDELVEYLVGPQDD